MELCVHTRPRFCSKDACRLLTMVLCMCLCLSMFLATNLEVAYCDPTEATEAGESIDKIQDIVTTGADKIYNIIRAIVIPIVIVFIAWAGILFLIGGSKGTEKARTIFIGCAAAIVFVAFAPVIGNEVGGWFKDSGTGPISDYNPLD